MKSASLRRQKGVTLIVGLIMLVLITLMVTTAFTLSNTNLKSVGNMQSRNESIAAANKAIEQVINSSAFAVGFNTPPTAQTVTLDINNDGVADYSVTVAAPVCIQATVVAGSQPTGSCSSVDVDIACGTAYYSTLWDIDASVTDAVSGSSVRVRQGVRLELTEDQRNAVCPLS